MAFSVPVSLADALAAPASMAEPCAGWGTPAYEQQAYDDGLCFFDFAAAAAATAVAEGFVPAWAEQSMAPSLAAAAVTAAVASPAHSNGTPRSLGGVGAGLATPLPLSLFESLSAAELSPLACPLTTPTELAASTAEEPARLSLFESLLAHEAAAPPVDFGSGEAFLLGPPPGLPAPPGLEDFAGAALHRGAAQEVKADLERTYSALSDGYVSESTATGSARVSELESMSPESAFLVASPASTPFGRGLAQLLTPTEAVEPFSPKLAALLAASAPAAGLAAAPGFVPALEPLVPPLPQYQPAHDPAQCRPCAWFWKRAGCKSGAQCHYCHECPESALKDRKKAKRAEARAEAASPNKPVAATLEAERHQIRLAALL